MKELGRISSVTINCRDCKADFVMARGEVIWYLKQKYPLPKRCPECRRKRKEAKEYEKKKNAPTSNAQ